MTLVARALWAVVAKSGTAVSQAVIATHSLEFIDALVATAVELKLSDLLSVHRLALTDGKLTVSSFSGDLVMSARADGEFDLR